VLNEAAAKVEGLAERPIHERVAPEPVERQGPIVREVPKVGRNEPCPYGSGKKYREYCGKA
jgi:preprotein translocase subunit SecA